jgi:hypothetical protein
MIAKRSPHLRPVAGRASPGPGPALDAQGRLRWSGRWVAVTDT